MHFNPVIFLIPAALALVGGFIFGLFAFVLRLMGHDMADIERETRHVRDLGMFEGFVVMFSRPQYAIAFALSLGIMMVVFSIVIFVIEIIVFVASIFTR